MFIDIVIILFSILAYGGLILHLSKNSHINDAYQSNTYDKFDEESEAIITMEKVEVNVDVTSTETNVDKISTDNNE